MDNIKKKYSFIADYTSILIEIYRVFMGTLFVLFVPGMCGNHRCNVYENFIIGDNLYHAGFGLNVITLFVFISLYFVELKRENKLKKYLYINHQYATDSESVGKALKKLSDDKYNEITNTNDLYHRIGYATFIMYVMNTILSGYIIFAYYLDDKSGPAFITNTLFIGGKLYDVYLTVNSDKNILVSAYNKNKLQFNDVQVVNQKLQIRNITDDNIV